MTIGFIGLGLIGGSIAKAIRKKHPEEKIIAYNRHIAVLDQAKNDGVIDVGVPFAGVEFSECDFIFLCTPVITALGFLDTLRVNLKPGCVLTDVGSTKTAIHEAIQNKGLTANFIGGHPMTGSEKTGYEHSDALFLENAYYLLTPGEDVPIESVSNFQAYIASLGAIPLLLSYEEHDYVTAAISHLPHVISASLVNLVHDLDGPDHLMQTIAAGGFKDITRISSSSPAMWQEICLANRGNILKVLDAYIQRLMYYRSSIDLKNEDSLLTIFSDCKEYRDSFTDEASGAIEKEYRITCDIHDEKGAIAKVAGILASEDINIRNIGILHNREYEQGVLRVLFYDEASSAHAADVLKGAGYTVYEN